MKNEAMDLLSHFLDSSGCLCQFPAKRKGKLAALCFLAEKFVPGRTYTEKEVNEILLSWHTFNDPATLRRELYNHCFLDRERDGSAYRLHTPQPTFAALLARYA